MKHQRRQFLRSITMASAMALSDRLISDDIQSSLSQLNDTYQDLSAAELAQKEDYWKMIHGAYSHSPDYINLNNGGVSPQPLVVQQAVEKYNRFSNEIPSKNMWHILDKGKEAIREKLAVQAGCSTEEIAIQRNATEALENVIFGLTLVPGDEVILSKQDYPSMKNAWKQRAQRNGIVLKWVDLSYPIDDDEVIIEAYRAAITDRTKIMHITHVINWNGRILPARRMADIAHEHGIEVVLDAAHSFCHFEYSIPDLDCDYYGTSLHKWLCAPFGTGMLYIKKGKIKDIYPLMAAPKPLAADIRKFEHLGTRSIAIEQGIGQAINFHRMIGSDKVEARLRYLKSYWCLALSDMDGISIGTSLHEGHSCGIALLQSDALRPKELTQKLNHDYGIHTVAIDYNNIKGVRITPQVYTLLSDLDKLILAVKSIVKS